VVTCLLSFQLFYLVLTSALIDHGRDFGKMEHDVALLQVRDFRLATLGFNAESYLSASS
jgi:hypothetical protein